MSPKKEKSWPRYRKKKTGSRRKKIVSYCSQGDTRRNTRKLSKLGKKAALFWEH